MKPEALVALVAFALGACGAEDWSFEEDAGDAGDAGARADSPDGGCTSDSDCKLFHCDTMSGQCVACVMDNQCTQLGLLFCVAERCAQCGVDADCGASQACQPTTHQCVTPCTSDGMCPNESLCGPAHVCVECLTDQDCFDGRVGPTQPQEECDTMSGQCAECTSDAQCPPLSVCDRTTDRCVGCLSNSDCPRDAACDPDVHICVGPTDASAFQAEGGR